MTDACFPDTGEFNKSVFHLTAYNSQMMLGKLADAVHKHGAKLCLQLSAGGGRTD